MGKKKTAAQTSEVQDEYSQQPETVAITQVGDTPAIEMPSVEDAPKPKSKKKSNAASAAKDGVTLSDLAERYIAAIDQDGAGSGTIASYGMELKLAQRELDENTLIADLTPERVQQYFDSPAVMRTRTNKPKAPPTYLKTQRVLRLALVWAAQEGLIASAPIPESAKKKAL